MKKPEVRECRAPSKASWEKAAGRPVAPALAVLSAADQRHGAQDRRVGMRTASLSALIFLPPPFAHS